MPRAYLAQLAQASFQAHTLKKKKKIPFARSSTGSNLTHQQPDEVCVYLCQIYSCINMHMVRNIDFLLSP